MDGVYVYLFNEKLQQIVQLDYSNTKINQVGLITVLLMRRFCYIKKHSNHLVNLSKVQIYCPRAHLNEFSTTKASQVTVFTQREQAAERLDAT